MDLSCYRLYRQGCLVGKGNVGEHDTWKGHGEAKREREGNGEGHMIGGQKCWPAHGGLKEGPRTGECRNVAIQMESGQV